MSTSEHAIFDQIYGIASRKIDQITSPENKNRERKEKTDELNETILYTMYFLLLHFFSVDFFEFFLPLLVVPPLH